MKTVQCIFHAMALLAAAAMLSCTGKTGYVAVRGYAQGGTYTVKANLKGTSLKPDIMARDIDSILVAIDNTLSGYNKGSLLSRLNNGDTVVSNPLLDEMLILSEAILEETGGAVDVASGELFDLWGFGFTRDSLPPAETVANVLSRRGKGLGIRRFGSDSLALEKAGGKPSVKLNFNAIAQGYSCDVVARYLKSFGITDMLVDIGEIYLSGNNPSGQSWKLAIDTPSDGNDTPGKDIAGTWESRGRSLGVVTSGNYRKFYVKDGRKYPHTLDPRNGYPVGHNLLSATVTAPDAARADALATYCMVIGTEKAKAFLQGTPDVEGYLISGTEDGGYAIWKSDNF